MRKLRRITQRELAARAGVSYRTVQTVEQALAPVRSSTMDRIAEALDTTLPELLSAEGRELPSIGERLRELRRDRKLSQEQLAEKAGVGAGVIGDLEQGRRETARIDTLAKLAGALGVALPVLFGAVMDEAEVGRLVREAYQAGWADALAEAATRLAALTP
jgi:transcriptional regulator with XRE-family HTH domain